ncbi:MOSC domain-containing protein [Corynebacterium renale]|uniref:MOSC domain-containing protein YiiM n=1 Tax=Corynebacterium renale TaxID=1724 RepID=A0A2A9DLQ4_9CORY|nr:MOSC domain-containing protein [Corynebacterium renale]PFG27628.1 MOSC domain-containing protein YiiM [Corynebacterium renale]SQI22775.1 6-N-hydroxylaminopurine resistance protein [Corynebacterium renale]
MRVLSTNIGQPRPSGVPRYAMTGIDKRPQPYVQVSAPGPEYGDGSGVLHDVVGDSQCHGGEQKAVYAFAREELDYWESILGRSLPNGVFGENLTTEGIDLSRLVINQQVQIGEVLLEVSVPRSPCAKFAAWVQHPGWLKKFTAHGDCGAYFRVVSPGVIRPADPIVLREAPDHGITMAEAFAAKMGNKEIARKVVAAHCLPGHHHEGLLRLV